MKRKFLPAVLVLAMVMVLVMSVFAACTTTQYTVTFRYSADNEKTVKVDAGAKVAASDIPAPTEGYAWYIADKDGNPSDTAFTSDTVVNGDMTVVLKKLNTTPSTPTQYTVTFRYSADNEQTVKVNEGEKIAADKIPTPTVGYAWYVADKDGNPSDTAFTSDTVVNSDMTVVLKQLITPPTQYTVTFRYSADNEKTVKVNEGEKIAADKIPTPTEHFTWYVANAEGQPTETAFTADTVVNGDMLVVLKEDVKYTVTFHYGEDNEQKVTVYEGEKVDNIPTPTEHHTWYVANAEGQPTETAFTADTEINADMLVVLKEDAKFTVTFRFGENDEQTKQVYIGETLSDIPAATAGHKWLIADGEGKATDVEFTSETVINGDMLVVLSEKDILADKTFKTDLVYSSSTWYWFLTFDGAGKVDGEAWFQGHRELSDDFSNGTYTLEQDARGLKVILSTGKSGFDSKTYYYDADANVIVYLDLDSNGNDKNSGSKFMYTDDYESPDLSAFAGFWASDDGTEWIWFSYENGKLTATEASFKTYSISANYNGKTLKIQEDSWGYTGVHILTLTDDGKISAKKDSNDAVIYTYKGETRSFLGFEDALVGEWTTSNGWELKIEKLKLTIGTTEVDVIDKTVSGSVHYEFTYNDAKYYIAKGDIAGEYFVFDANGNKQFLYSEKAAAIDEAWYGNYTFTVNGTEYKVVVSEDGVTVNNTTATKVSFLEPTTFNTSYTKGGIYFFDEDLGDVYLYRYSRDHKQSWEYGVQIINGSSANATKELDAVAEPDGFTLEGIWYNSSTNYFFYFKVAADGTITAICDYDMKEVAVTKLATSGRYSVTIGSTVCEITVKDDGTLDIKAAYDYTGIYSKAEENMPHATFDEKLYDTWNTKGNGSGFDSIGEVTIDAQGITFSINGVAVEVHAIKVRGSYYYIFDKDFNRWILAKSGDDWRLYGSKQVDVLLIKEEEGEPDPFEEYYAEVAGDYESGDIYITFNNDTAKTVEYENYSNWAEASGTWKITAVSDDTITVEVTSSSSKLNGTWTYNRKTGQITLGSNAFAKKGFVADDQFANDYSKVTSEERYKNGNYSGANVKFDSTNKTVTYTLGNGTAYTGTWVITAVSDDTITIRVTMDSYSDAAGEWTYSISDGWFTHSGTWKEAE